MSLDPSILKRIRALIALSVDTSTTEGERRLALKRASELMARYSILNLEEEKDPVILQLQLTTKLSFGMSRYTLCQIAGVVGENFGCYASMRPHTDEVWLWGFKVNCEITDYTIASLVNQGRADLRSIKEARTTGLYVQFWKGFIVGLMTKFTKLSDSTAIAVYDKVRDLFEATVRMVSTPLSGSSASGFGSGATSAKNAYLNPGLPSSQTGGVKQLG